MKKENAEYTEYSAYMADGKLVYVERSLKNGTDELTEYIWAGSTLWAEKRTTGTESAVYYHHTDYHGSTEAITDEAGVVVWKAGYNAYGNMLEATGEMEFEASFTGKMFDKDSGLYYFNARWYDSELGRFTTPDPARDGTNWLVYCAANPVGRWDPSGLTVLDDYAYQQRTNSQPGSEEYEESFKIEEEAARRNQGASTKVATPQSRWNDTIEPAITRTFWEVSNGLLNFDFGLDSFKKAGYAWNNGQYIKALLDSTNGIGEAVLDCLFIYQTAAKYGPWIEALFSNNKSSELQTITLQTETTSGVKLQTTPNRTTTILGRYDSDTGRIIEELKLPKSFKFTGNKGGFNLLNVPDNCYITTDQFWKDYNQPFLDAAINRGDRFLMATPCTEKYLFKPGLNELTGFGREFFYLRENGYELFGNEMIKVR